MSEKNHVTTQTTNQIVQITITRDYEHSKVIINCQQTERKSHGHLMKIFPAQMSREIKIKTMRGSRSKDSYFVTSL